MGAALSRTIMRVIIMARSIITLLECKYLLLCVYISVDANDFYIYSMA